MNKLLVADKLDPGRRIGPLYKRTLYRQCKGHVRHEHALGDMLLIAWVCLYSRRPKTLHIRHCGILVAGVIHAAHAFTRRFLSLRLAKTRSPTARLSFFNRCAGRPPLTFSASAFTAMERPVAWVSAHKGLLRAARWSLEGYQRP